MFRPSLSTFLFSFVLAYVFYSGYSFYQLFYPKQCEDSDYCLPMFFSQNHKFNIEVYDSKSQSSVPFTTFQVVQTEAKQIDINLTLPSYVKQNKSMILDVYLIPDGHTKSHSHTVEYSIEITKYRVPSKFAYNLLSGQKSNSSSTKEKKSTNNRPVIHWNPKLIINSLSDVIIFDRRDIAPELLPIMKPSNGQRALLPFVWCNPFILDEKQLIHVTKSMDTVPLTVMWEPLSIGRLRMWRTLDESAKQMIRLGFKEKDIVDAISVFGNTNFYFIMITLCIVTFHVLFDFLAFKNDISFWRKTDNTAGLSARVVIWRCFSSTVVTLYLWDEETSLLVLIPAGISMLIEYWKVKRMFKVTWNCGRISLGERTSDEKVTDSLDSQGMKYLSYIMLPLCIGGTIYSLLYVHHKSWFSWSINSLANCVYAFGFLFMLPQLFINYKLKSVAHLPWKALTYKAFNTFIDDFFAFIITMPTSHRLACFRDDVVFLIYIYQRWLYPVDKSRVNEYGQKFDDKKSKLDNKKDE